MDQLQDHNLFDLEVSEETKSHLSGLTLWMNITAITGLAGSVISIIFTVLRMSAYSYGSGGIALLWLLVVLAVSILLNITLLAAARNIKQGLSSEDQGSLNAGVGKIASYFRIYGIVLICALALCVLAFVFAAIVGIAGGFRR
jgi:hypothetical protein